MSKVRTTGEEPRVEFTMPIGNNTVRVVLSASETGIHTSPVVEQATAQFTMPIGNNVYKVRVSAELTQVTP